MSTAIQTVTSADGTSIGFERYGTGPALVLVYGATGTRDHPMWRDLADRLARDFHVFAYDRRGRGDSGDTLPYAVEREVEDIEAVIDAAGGRAFLYGVSSGAVLALETASRLPSKVEKAVLYEPPFIVDDSHPPLPKDYVQKIEAAIAAGDRTTAASLFFTDALGMPAEYVTPMQQEPWWPGIAAVAHTIAYDGRVMGETMSGRPLPAGAWSTATMPVLVLAGGNSEPFFHTGTKALADLLPNARHDVLAGQDHAAGADALAPVITAFLRDRSGSVA